MAAPESRRKKKIRAVVKLQIPAGQATPAPPVGTALGPHGVNIMEFVRSYNERTASQTGTVVPVQVTIYEDRSRPNYLMEVFRFKDEAEFTAFADEDVAALLEQFVHSRLSGPGHGLIGGNDDTFDPRGVVQRLQRNDHLGVAVEG